MEKPIRELARELQKEFLLAYGTYHRNESPLDHLRRAIGIENSILAKLTCKEQEQFRRFLEKLKEDTEEIQDYIATDPDGHKSWVLQEQMEHAINLTEAMGREYEASFHGIDTYVVWVHPEGHKPGRSTYNPGVRGADSVHEYWAGARKLLHMVATHNNMFLWYTDNIDKVLPEDVRTELNSIPWSRRAHLRYEQHLFFKHISGELFDDRNIKVIYAGGHLRTCLRMKQEFIREHLPRAKEELFAEAIYDHKNG